MGKRAAALILLVVINSACSDLRLHVRESSPGKGKPVIISRFRVRGLNCSPFLGEKFRDALRFEFFRRGFCPFLPGPEENIPHGSEAAGKYCRDRGACMYITGVISMTEKGLLREGSSSSSVVFHVYGSDGKTAAEGYYTTDRLVSEESVMRDAASEFAELLIMKSQVSGG